MRPQYFIGLDLGQQQDYTALTIVKKVIEEVEEPKRQHSGPITWLVGTTRRPVFREYQLQVVERFDLGTPYMDVARRTREVQRGCAALGADTYVVADATGVGRPCLELLKKEGVENLIGISIHGGDAVGYEGSVFRVPKRDLVSTLQVLLQNNQIAWNERVPFRQVLDHELHAFRAKIDLQTGHDSYEAWREKDHDDIVLSLAIACWYGQRRQITTWADVPAINRI